MPRLLSKATLSSLSLIILLEIGFIANISVSGEKISIVHWNDFSGQLEKFEPGSDQASLPPSSAKCVNGSSTCIGGLVNVVNWIERLHDQADSTIPLGNRFKVTTGNLVGGENGWLSVLGWEKYGHITGAFYKPTVMSLGMKEFSAGIARTNQYLVAANEAGMGRNPVVLSNADCRQPLNCSMIKTMVELTPQIGVLGFINPDVEKLSSPADLKFKDIVSSLKAAVAFYKQYRAFIAIGDGSLDLARIILDSVPEIKLVIYGRAFGSSKDMKGDYPMKYKDKYIATAGKYGSTVGKLVLEFDSNYNIIKTTGSLLQTTTTAALEGDLALAATDYMPELESSISNEKNSILGQSIFQLMGGDRCWRHECNLGNLVADSMVHCGLNRNGVVLPPGEPLLSLWHGGALFADNVPSRQDISKFDIHRWLPFHNRAHLVSILGKHLLEVFGTSASGITANQTEVRDWGQFLQVSNGLEVYYNTEKKEPVVEKIRVLHENSDGTPTMQEVKLDKAYYFVIPSFILEGRTVYDKVQSYWKNVSDIGFDDDCVENYIKAMGKVSTGFEERIWINAEFLPVDGSSSSKSGNTFITVLLTIVFMVIIIAVVYVGWFFVIPKLRGTQPGRFNHYTNDGI